MPRNKTYILKSCSSHLLKRAGTCQKTLLQIRAITDSSISLYEAVFTAACRDAFSKREFVQGKLKEEEIDALETDPAFVKASTFGTTAATNVRDRLGRAKALIFLH